MSRGRSDRSELIRDLGRVAREYSLRTVMFHSAVAERLGLGTTDHRCLEIVSRTGPITAGRLAELTGLTTGAITGVVDRLEQAGYVRRERDSNDRRRVNIHPFPDPERAREVDALYKSWAKKWAELCMGYSDKELSFLLGFMNRVNPMLHDEMLRLRHEAESGDGK